MLSFLKKLFGGEPSADIKALLSEGAIILDVRSKGEYNSGHVKGAVHIPLNLVNTPAKLKQIKGYKKTIITCCASGRRSGIAAKLLTAKGIEAYNGGAWTTVRAKKGR